MAQLLCHGGIVGFRTYLQTITAWRRGRLHPCAKTNLHLRARPGQDGAPGKTAIPRPNGKHSVESHRNDRDLKVRAENGSSLLEFLHFAVNRTFPLREEHENFSMAQAKCTRLQRSNQVGIGIHGSEAHPFRRFSPERRGKVFAGANVKKFAEHSIRKRARQEKRIKISLMAGTDKIGYKIRKILEAGKLEPNQNAREQIPQFEDSKTDERNDSLRF